jgi:hypothetical protein
VSSASALGATVRQPAGGEQAAAEGERVGGDHPRHAGRAQPEVVLHGGQGDGDDRRVEHDDELGDAEQDDGHGPGLPTPCYHQTPIWR